MKFCENGPNIPNSLIRERDAGKVVFICGAGVSMQSSGLPNFLQLASQVMDELLVPEEDKIRESLNQGQIGSKNKSLPIDRIFSQLEQDYDAYEIEQAISKILSLSSWANTACHEIVYDLATAPSGHTRLITTNFDDLFSRVASCDEMIYPNLSEIDDEHKFSNLIYLHGRCVGNGLQHSSELVLSSRSFGNAYLVDGKASQLLKSVFSKFTVVFIGYSSDDPPIQYLLEALAQTESSSYNVYAFQKEGQEANNERWLFQKVKPIYFGKYDDLWDTLLHWSHYCSNPVSWINSVLKMAEKGPSSLADWQRSQVAYLASDTLGTKAISKLDPPLSPQWLFCFDPAFRYAMPRDDTFSNDQLEQLDPFKVLGLSEDTLPPQSRIGFITDQTREIPDNAWDAFDGTGTHPAHTSDPKITLENPNIEKDIITCNKHLATWIANISDIPETAYWAIFRGKLNQDLRKRICDKVKLKLGSSSAFSTLEWKTIFENWELFDERHEGKFSKLEDDVEKSGWSPTFVTEYRKLSKPILIGVNSRRFMAVFPDNSTVTKLSNFVKVNPSYNLTKITSIESGKHIIKLLKIERRNLNFVIEHMKQNGSYKRWTLIPLCTLTKGNALDQSLDIHMPVIRFLERFKQLVDTSPSKAKEELKTWPADDLNVFGRLRIWAAGDSRILSDRDASELFSLLPSGLFWGEAHREDLQHSLKARWGSLTSSAKDLLEKRVLRGCEPRVDANIQENYEKSISLAISYGTWIIENNLKVSDGFITKFDDIKKEHSPRTDTDIVISSMDKRVQRKGGHTQYLRRLRELCKSQLSLILISLRRKAKSGNYPTAEWRIVLSDLKNKQWTARRIWYTATVLREAPDEFFEGIGDEFTKWFSNKLAFYDGDDVSIRDEYFDRLVRMIKYEIMHDVYSDISEQIGEFKWVVSHTLSHSGLLASSLFGYKEIRQRQENSSISGLWLDAATSLMSLPGNGKRYALSYFATEIQQLYRLSPKWTKSYILTSDIDSDYNTSEAFWMGFSKRANKNIGIDFDLFTKIKPHLIVRLSRPLAPDSVISRHLAHFLLMGWLRRRDGERWVSDSDFGKVLKSASSVFQKHILNGLNAYVTSRTSKGNFDWVLDIEKFFVNVWPRTRAAKSDILIRRVLDITFISPKYSSRLSLALIPRIGRITPDHPVLSYLLEHHSSILKSHPSVAFEFLCVLLKNCYQGYPRDTNTVVSEIEKCHPKIRNDIRFKRILKTLSK